MIMGCPSEWLIFFVQKKTGGLTPASFLTIGSLILYDSIKVYGAFTLACFNSCWRFARHYCFACLAWCLYSRVAHSLVMVLILELIHLAVLVLYSFLIHSGIMVLYRGIMVHSTILVLLLLWFNLMEMVPFHSMIHSSYVMLSLLYGSFADIGALNATDSFR